MCPSYMMWCERQRQSPSVATWLTCYDLRAIRDRNIFESCGIYIKLDDDYEEWWLVVKLELFPKLLRSTNKFSHILHRYSPKVNGLTIWWKFNCCPMDGWMDMELIQNKSQEEPKRPLNNSLEQIDKRYRIVENFSVF